ncbi:uncharacterized protein BJ171DRAFT_487443 [Polychytrium aggregatum]|uniref:uncharacterized protein n=1 Tax=Polychytrium aggregatum TaxID=110093 RepID=UPI0022FDDA6D|nr:uncharacterized protein BJ171DRAFT_487443 [Polychytrium aggregatum]KAI9208821.1 hypothetical protein BJ171DRAFT_487443 [Polychytrium aggregatum]
MTVALQFSQPLASVVTQIQQDFPEIKRISFYSLTSDGKNLHSRFSSSTLVREMLSTVSQSETKGFRIELDNFNVLVALPTLLERVEPLKHELAFVEKKIEEMNVVKDHCDKIAHRYSESVLRLSFGGLLVYWVVGIRLTWWELGWDVMEPFTYFCGIGFALATYVWYMLTRQEYTYDSLKSLSQNIKLKEIYRQRGFDATEYEHHVKRAEKLTHLIAEIRAEYGEDAIDELRDHHLAKKNV